VLVVDSWRADALDERVTPRLEALAREARRFDDHLSSGNGTRFGVFGMLYGLHGSYWWSVLAERRPPVLLEVLDRLGYELRVFSAASQDFPEFRSTAWARWPGAVVDEFDAARQCARDEQLADACIAWWRERAASGRRRPAFTFVLLDSAHQTYDFPDGRAPFQPYAEELDYFEMSRSHAPELALRVRNRYLNALHHADAVAGRLVDELERLGSDDDTLLVVTGDHGEEFAENGFWGHTGNFTPEQIAVPLLLRGPGVEPGVEQRPTTHLDLAPTLLELLGADPARAGSWCLGRSLLDPAPRRRRVVAGWSEVGVVTELGILRVPRSSSAAAAISVWTREWRLVEGQAEVLGALSSELERLDEECNRFLAETLP
jgi:membrane-anchored protein YejM (alkaline phosphatase superfamily)